MTTQLDCWFPRFRVQAAFQHLLSKLPTKLDHIVWHPAGSTPGSHSGSFSSGCVSRCRACKLKCKSIFQPTAPASACDDKREQHSTHKVHKWSRVYYIVPYSTMKQSLCASIERAVYIIIYIYIYISYYVLIYKLRQVMEKHNEKTSVKGWEPVAIICLPAKQVLRVAHVFSLGKYAILAGEFCRKNHC